jgi:superoxide reductase
MPTTTAQLSQTIQQGDWKSEKHVPIISSPDRVQANEIFPVTVTIGHEVSHPNTTEHHIRWIRLYFLEADGKFPREVATVEFNAHGESAKGADQGPVYTHHGVTTQLKLSQPGTLFAESYCNIHGLWESSCDIQVD